LEFIHIDYSQANRDATEADIIAATREVVDYAKQTTGALIESEPHHFGDSSNVHTDAIDYDEISETFSTPGGAASFVAETGIDTYAAAVGNLHGRYCNISLHGGSGTPGHYFQEAARIGVSKINVNSDLRYAYRTTLEAQLKANPDQYTVLARCCGYTGRIAHRSAAGGPEGRTGSPRWPSITPGR
jgi:fructose-bisphosphate aldolase, class II